jgi:ComF family protein
VRFIDISFLKTITDSFKEALFPTRCRLCKAFFTPPAGAKSNPMDTNFGVLMGAFLCPACADKFLPVESPICSICGNLFSTTAGEDHLCGGCITQPKKFTKARSVGIYDQSLLGVIHCLKYKGQVELALPLGRLLLGAYLTHWSSNEIDVVMPVPLHKKRLRARGFNQSYLLIRQWPKWLENTHDRPNTVSVSRNILLRHRHTPPQTKLGRKHRVENMRHAFSVKKSIAIQELRILLIDDVYTTGATANACAEALLKAGAKQVDMLTLARTKN